jgi:hypothetical protein
MCKLVFLPCVGSGISLTNIYLSVCFLHNEVNKCVTCAAAHILASVQRPCSERSQRLDFRPLPAACSAELEEDMIRTVMEAANGMPYRLAWQAASFSSYTGELHLYTRSYIITQITTVEPGRRSSQLRLSLWSPSSQHKHKLNTDIYR